MKNELMTSLVKINEEIEAIESILADGIEYDKDFLAQLHDEVKALIKTSVSIKGLLVTRYGVVAI